MKYTIIIFGCFLSIGGLYADYNPDMGTTDLNVTHFSGQDSHPKISFGNDPAATYHIVDMTYDDETAARVDLNVSILSTDGKPTTVRVRHLSSPWLVTDDEDFFDVRFIQRPTEWTGHGKTGHVVNDDINFNKTRRLEW